MQHLVGVGVAHPGEHRLVPQQALELLAGAGSRIAASSATPKPGASGSGPEPGDARDVVRRVDDVDGQPLLGARLGEVEAGAVVEVHPGGQRALAHPRRHRGQRLGPAQPAGPGQVGDQVQPGDVQVEELAVPGHAGDLEPLQRGHRRVVGLQHAEGGEVDAGHDPPDGTLGQEGDQRLHLGKLRHVSSVPHRSSPDSAESCPAPGGADVWEEHRTPTSETTPWTTPPPARPRPARRRLRHTPRRLVAALLTALALVLTALVTGAAAAGPAGGDLGRGQLHRQAEPGPGRPRHPAPDHARRPGRRWPASRPAGWPARAGSTTTPS